MLNVLILSKTGEGYDFATRLAKEKNIVKFYGPTAVRDNYEDVKVVRDWKQHFEAADLILLPTPGFGQVVHSMADRRRVFGCGLVGQLLKEESFKMNVLSFLPTSELVEDGSVKVGVGGLFNGVRFTSTYIVFHTERFMDGDKGLETEGMGCSARFVGGKVVEETLYKLSELLIPLNFSGCIELECFVGRTLISVDNISVEFKNGCFQALKEDVRHSLSTVLLNLTQDGKSLDTKGEFVVSVGLSVPPWPYIFETESPVLEVEVEGADKHLWLSECRGFLGYSTARGATLREARRRAYRTIKNISFPLLQYREDIGDMKTECDYKKLIDWGWINADASRDVAASRESASAS